MVVEGPVRLCEFEASSVWRSARRSSRRVRDVEIGSSSWVECEVMSSDCKAPPLLDVGLSYLGSSARGGMLSD